MVAHEIEERHYDPETGDYDGQLVHADLVDQLPPPTHPLPDLDNTVKTLFFWAMDLDIPHGPRLALLTILRHIDWKEGSGCWASLPTLAKEAQFSIKTMVGHIKYLLAQNLITRHRRMSRPSETRLNATTKAEPTVSVETTPTVSVETTPTVSVETTLTSQRSGNASNQSSSSTNPFNQKVPGLVDASKVDTSRSEPEPGVTNGGFKSSSFEEEGATGARVTGDELTVEEAQAWVDGHLSETPQPFEIQQVGKHCWPAWSNHWNLDLAGAIVVWTKTDASRRKFRKDVVMHLVKVGLPKPKQADPEQEAARSGAGWLWTSV